MFNQTPVLSAPLPLPGPMPVGLGHIFYADTCVKRHGGYAFTCAGKWEGHSLTHAYILVHTHACDPAHTHESTKENTLNLYPLAGFITHTKTIKTKHHEAMRRLC